MYFAYTVLLSLALLASAPWWLLGMLRHGKYRAGFRERLGFVPARLREAEHRETIWIHAVSVGEVLAVSRIVEELQARLPGWRVVISTTTDTGQKLARQRYGEDNVFYFPLDLPSTVRAYLKALRPQLLVLAESEFWPNLLHEAHRSGVAIAVINARVSDRSLPRYLLVHNMLSRVMGNVDLFLAQSDEDARRLAQIGAPANRVHVGGNLKFEVKTAGETPVGRVLEEGATAGGVGPTLIAGSTLEGEEELLIECFRQVVREHSNALMILAPRHPERFDTVARMVAASGLPWRRRSEWDGSGFSAGGIFLLDSIGELAGLYRLADVAFIGGSLVPRGGHNVLEAAQFGVPILVGPHTENFRDIVSIFERGDALRAVTPASLTMTVVDLLSDRSARQELGARALQIMCRQEGATERTVEVLLTLLHTDFVMRNGEVFSGRQA